MSTGTDAQTCKLICLDENIEDMKVLTVEPLKDLGTPSEIVNIFGGKQNYFAALKELEDEIYMVA